MINNKLTFLTNSLSLFLMILPFSKTWFTLHMKPRFVEATINGWIYKSFSIINPDLHNLLMQNQLCCQALGTE